MPSPVPAAVWVDVMRAAAMTAVGAIGEVDSSLVDSPVLVYVVGSVFATARALDWEGAGSVDGVLDVRVKLVTRDIWVLRGLA